MSISELLETLMLICFSTSWYWSIRKVWRTQDSRGMPKVFPAIVAVGSLLGLGAKIAAFMETGILGFVVWIYAWNVILSVAQLVLIVKLDDQVDQSRISGVGPGELDQAIG